MAAQQALGANTAGEISVRAATAGVPNIILDSTAPHSLLNVSPSVFEALTEKNLWGAGATNTNVVMTTFGKIVASHMGVTMYAPQKNTLDLLERLVVKTAVGDESVPLRFVLQKMYAVTDQLIAEMGTPDTITGGSNTRRIDVSVPMTGRVAPMLFESGILEQTSEQVADVINRELARVETVWSLTKIHEIVSFCANQLTMTEATAIAVRKSTPAARIRDIVSIMDVVCGSINMNPAVIYSLISTGIDLAVSLDTPMAIVMPRCIHKALTSGSLVTGGLTMGSVENTHKEFLGFSIDATGNSHTIQPNCYNVRYTESPAMKQAADKMTDVGTETGKCYYLFLSNGKEIPVISIDDVTMDSKGNSLQDGMCTKNAVRAEFFTVGAMAPVVKDIHPAAVFEAGSEIDPGKLFVRSPDTTAVHCYSDASAKKVSLQQLHKVSNPAALFATARSDSLTANLASIPLADYTNDHVLAMLRAKTWQEKMAVPQAQYEVDARFRVTQHAAAARGAERIIMNRSCLFNMSPLNDVESEVVQIGAEMAQMITKLPLDMLEVIKTGLYDVGTVADVRRVRGGGAINNHNYTPLMYTDPQCFLRVLADLAGIAQRTQVQDAMYVQMSAFYRSIISAFHQVSGASQRSLLADMPLLFGGNMQHAEDGLFVRIMQYIVLPMIASGITAPALAAGARDPRVAVNANDLNGRVGSAVTVVDGVFISGPLPQGERNASNAVLFMSEDDHVIPYDSIVTRMWAYRIKTMKRLPVEVALLVGMHYMLKLTRSNFLEWFDTKHYSGWSYLCLRYVRFDSWGMSIMPQKNAIYHYGKSGVVVRQTHDRLSATMFRESAITTASLDKMGMFVDNAYMTNIRGGDLVLPESDTRASGDAIVIVDGFNSFVPNSQISTSNAQKYIFAHGRSDPDFDQTLPDPMLEQNMYSTMPTLHPTMSATNVRLQQYGHNRGRDETNAGIFLKQKRVSDLDDMFIECRNDPRTYYAEKLSRPPNSGKIYSANNGVVFCATYAIGRLSDSTLMYGSDYRTIADRLAPRIGGTGLFCGSSVSEVGTAFGATLNRTLVVPWRRHMQF